MRSKGIPGGRLRSDSAALASLIAQATLRTRFLSIEGGTIGENTQLPPERALARSFTPIRYAQFVAGRIYARRAIERLGFVGTAITQDADGVAVWPKEISGSIAHKHMMCVAVAASRSKYAGLGVDLEKDEPRDEASIANTIAQSDELAQLRRYRALGLRSPSTGLLSAKEAVYKAAFPTLRRTIEWLDIHIKVTGDGSFHAKVEGSPEWFGTGILFVNRDWMLALSWPRAKKPKHIPRKGNV